MQARITSQKQQQERKEQVQEVQVPEAVKKPQPMKKAKHTLAPKPAVAEPTFSDPNAFSLLLPQQQQQVNVKVKVPVKKAKHALPDDPAILSVNVKQQHIPYQRATIPRPNTNDPLLAVQLKDLSGLDQISTHITSLEASLHASWEESTRIEAQMRDILVRSAFTTSAKPTDTSKPQKHK